MKSFPLLILAAVASSAAAAPRIGPDGNEYEIVFTPSAPLTWIQAKNQAEQTNGRHLATIDSESVDLFIEELRQETLSAAGIDPFASGAPALWIGGSQEPSGPSPAEGWNWVHGDGPVPVGGLSPGYANWLAGEPNDWSSPVEDNEENFLAIGHRGRFGWNDAGAGSLQGYVVEKAEFWRRDSYSRRDPATNRRYEVVLDSERTWEEAERYSRTKSNYDGGARLATLTTPEEATFVRNLLAEAVEEFGYGSPQNPHHDLNYWLGASRQSGGGASSAGWSWIAGQGALAANDPHWASGQPDGLPAGGRMGLTLDHALGKWKDSGEPTRGYVLEYDLTEKTTLPQRSSIYTGFTFARTPYQPSYTPNVEVTLEAWVLRERDGITETILSQGFTDSLWFGFAGNKLRFYRSGGDSVDSTREVGRGEWAHVAVSYDGTTARFYINGYPSGEGALSHNGPGTTADIHLGADPVTGARFKGQLDEVRLWSTAKGHLEINDNRFHELRGSADLRAVWPRGDGMELVSGYQGGFGSARPSTTPNGILPHDLVVPLAAIDPRFDGQVDLAGEYLGAEQAVLRYQDGPITKDAVAYLVHTHDYLYVGIRGARLPASGEPSADNMFSAMIDADRTTSALDGELVRGEATVLDGAIGFSRVDTRTFGGGPFPITVTDWYPESPPSYQFQGRTGGISSEFSAPDIEFRFHRDLLGPFDEGEVDRLALTHTNHGGPSSFLPWFPNLAVERLLRTWSNVRYHPRPGGSLPTVNVTAKAFGVRGGNPLSGLAVHLRGVGVNYASAMTDDSGQVRFRDIVVGEGVSLEVVLETPDGARAIAPFIETNFGIQPVTVSPTLVGYPGCTFDGGCGLAEVHFYLELPLGATRLAEFSPARVWPPVLLREGPPPLRSPGSQLTVSGANLHDELTFFLAKPHCPINLGGCSAGHDYFPVSATFHPANAEAPPRYLIEIPEEITEFDHGAMRLTAHDGWARPANNPALLESWKVASDLLVVGAPPYPLVHGFAFQNQADGHDVDDYRAAFYDQACNPLYMVGLWAFSPIYLSILGGGECLGMTAAANEFYHGRPTSLLEADVLFGAGFRTGGTALGAPTPATFNVDNFCSPAPTNVWAAIRANHGVQTSSEFFGKTLEQFRFDPLRIDLADQLERLRGRPLDYMLCIRNGSSGHCVQPLRVIDVVLDETGAVRQGIRQIEIWDCNYPFQMRAIDIDLNRNCYTYDGGFAGESVWTANWMLIYEIAPLYNNERHVPSLDVAGYALAQFGVTHLWEFFQMFVSGEAEPLLTSADGKSQAGWTNRGSFVEKGDDIYAVPNFNWRLDDPPPLGHYPMSFLHRTGKGTPAVEIHSRGGAYKFHSSHHGTMFQLFINRAVEGTTDLVNCDSCDGSAGRVSGIDFQAGAGGRLVTARIALCRNAKEYPLAVSAGAVSVPEGAGLGLETLPDGTGFHFDNDTGNELKNSFELVLPSPAGREVAIFDTPAVIIPDGARVTVASPDGNDFYNLVFAIDYGRDGQAETVMQYSAAADRFVPYSPPPTVWLEVNTSPIPGAVDLVHPDGLKGWVIETSQSLEGEWRNLDAVPLEVSIANGLVTTTVPIIKEGTLFFRLALR